MADAHNGGDVSTSSMSEREKMTRNAAHDLLRAADEMGGSEHSTKVAIGRIDQAQRDLAMVRTALYVRLAQIQGAV